MTDILEKCARAAHNALRQKLFAMNGYTKLPHALEKEIEVVEDVVRAVIAALADGVTDEMCNAAVIAGAGDQATDETFDMWMMRLRKVAISAAIRAAIPEGK